MRKKLAFTFCFLKRTIRNFRIVQQEGSRQVERNLKHYNLQMIMAVGFKVNNERAVQFRQWATKELRTFTVQGYVFDKQRLENGQIFDEDYFDHLLDEIR